MATTSNFPSYTQDPQANLDYSWDWSQWLSGGETISSVAWTLAPSGLTQGTTSNTTSSATIWLSAGATGTQYTVTCRVTTSAGRVDERSATIRVQNR